MQLKQPVSLVVISAGLRQPSSTRLLADRLAAAAQRDLEAATGRVVQLRVIELRELATDIANHLVTGFPGARLADALKATESADGLIAVSPIFSASYSGLFKSYFDLIDNTALSGKPVLIAATGGSARHSLALEHALRPLFSYLRAVVVPTAVYAATEDWGATGEHGGDLAGRIDRAAGQLAALLSVQPQGTVPVSRRGGVSEFGKFGKFGGQDAAEWGDDEVIPFEQLLAQEAR